MYRYEIYFIYYWIIFRSYVNTNICSYTENAEPVCCYGWVKNVYGDCIKNECFQECGYGKCVGLNICECFDGSTRSDPCPYPKERSCPDNCSNKGKCRDLKCVCDSGFSGTNCNSTVVAACYVKVNRGLCKSIPESIQLSKEECCAIFDMAWGNPCEFCNEVNRCGKGYILRNGNCEDIDECQINGMCRNGQCFNERGSFRCQCPPQHVLNEETMACQQYKEICDIFAANCGPSGDCVPLITGDYKCVCREPYETSDDGKRCLKRKSYNVCKMFGKLCQPHGECQPSGLSYSCKCQQGFIQSHDRKSCRIDLTSSNINNEDPCRNPEVSQKCTNGQCISESNIYRCLCYPPYKSSVDGQECVLMLPKNGYCRRREYWALCQGGQCVDTSNGYYCQCGHNYVAVDNGRRCERSDMNNGRNPDYSNIYCANKEYASRCNGGRCIGDQIYGFKCLCLPGFTVAVDGRACYPVKPNVCESNRHRCGSGRCVATGDDDFQCECPPEMTKSEDGRGCMTFKISTKPSSSFCDNPQYRDRCATGECVYDNYYGFKCICAHGYKASEDGRACYKIITLDSCSSNGHKCLSGGCRPFGEYDYQCECPSYLRQSSDGRSCITNEVTERSISSYCDIASYRERCVTGECVSDTYYGFRCICRQGYTTAPDGRACLKTETSEALCSRQQWNCRGGRCIELSNSDYECRCIEEYRLSPDRRSCVKDPSENACSRYQSKCNGGKCIVRQNNDYECECGKGYFNSNDGRSCIKEIRSMCDTHGHRCLTGICYARWDKDYFCVCDTGHRPIENSRACAKITQSSQCSTYAYKCRGNQCIDKTNDYTCVCLHGYTASDDQRSCEKNKVEEKCSEYRNRCLDGMCFDTDTGYLCMCLDKSIVSVDGRYCIQKDMIVLRTADPRSYPLLGDSESVDCSRKDFKHTSDPGKCVSTDQGYARVCPDSYKVSTDGQRCIRDENLCQQCYHGCNSLGTSSECLCPVDHTEVIGTGLCIKNEDHLEYKITEFHCDSERKVNKTFVIRFKVVLLNTEASPNTAYQNIKQLLQPKQLKSATLNSCVLSPGHRDSVKRVQRKPPRNYFRHQVVCLFDC